MTSLRRQAATGVAWSGGATTYVVILQVVQTSVLARYLAPEHLGMFAIVLVVVGFAQGFVDLGASNALVQQADLTRKVRSSVFWGAMMTGVLATGLVAFASHALAVYYETPPLRGLIILVAAALPALAVAQVCTAFLQRDLQFRTISVIEAAATSLSAPVTIVCAVIGEGAHAPIIGYLVLAYVRALMLMARALRRTPIQFRLRRSDFAAISGFSAFQLAERSVNFLGSNLDYLIIGKFLGPAVLGPYYIAYQVVIQPTQRLGPILSRVAFPVFARVQGDSSKIGSGFLELSRFIALVALPLLVGLGVVAPSFFPIYAGDDWRTASQLAQFLVPVALLRVMGHPVGAVLLALGRADLGFFLNAGRALANVVVFRAVVSYGASSVALAYGGTTLLAFLAGQWAVKSLTSVTFSSFLRGLIRIAFASVLMGVVVASSQIALTGSGLAPVHGFLFLVTLGGSVYLLTIFRCERDLMESVRTHLQSRAESNEGNGARLL